MRGQGHHSHKERFFTCKTAKPSTKIDLPSFPYNRIMNIISRHNWLLILQGWSILWVVIGNTYLGQPGNEAEWESTLLRTAYTFHFPLLMFTFGCIFCKKFLLGEDGKNTVETKEDILGLIIPFLLFTIIAVIAKAALAREPYNLGALISGLIRGLIYPGLRPASAMWFILVLICYYFLLPVWKATFRKSWLMWIAAAVLLMTHFIMIPIELLCIKWIFYFSVYFYFGMMVMKKGWLDYLSGLTGFYIFIVGYLIYFMGFDTDRPIAEIGGIIFSIGVVLLLNNTFPKAFSTFRDYYFQIFLIGYFVQVIFCLLFDRLSIPHILGYLICLAMGIYIPVFMTRIIQSKNLSPLDYCIGLSMTIDQPTVGYDQNKLAVEL